MKKASHGIVTQPSSTRRAITNSSLPHPSHQGALGVQKGMGLNDGVWIPPGIICMLECDNHRQAFTKHCSGNLDGHLKLS